MSAVSFQLVFDDGEVAVDELMPLDFVTVEKLEKRFAVDGRMGTIRIIFDPPLFVPPPTTAPDD